MLALFDDWRTCIIGHELDLDTNIEHAKATSRNVLALVKNKKVVQPKLTCLRYVKCDFEIEIIV